MHKAPNFTLIALASLMCLLPVSAAVAELDAPQGRVILTVSGNIEHTNATTSEGDQVANFDRDMLSALDRHTTRTNTPWHDGVTDFTGPLARTLMDTVGAEGDQVLAVALNEYQASIPMADFYDHDVILATQMNGEPLSVREKGPIFVIYPFDQNPELNTEIIYARSAWQVRRLVVE